MRVDINEHRAPCSHGTRAMLAALLRRRNIVAAATKPANRVLFAR
jgi:hypothetical protein